MAIEGMWPEQVDKGVAEYWKARDAQWPGIGQIEQQYYAAGQPEELKQYLLGYWDWKKDYQAAHPEVKWYSEQMKMQRLYEEYPKMMADEIVAYLYDEDVRWGQMDMKALQDEYFDLKDQSNDKARAYLGQHPELKAYWDWKRAWRENSQGVDLYLDRYKVGEQIPDWWGEFDESGGMDQINLQGMSPSVLQSAMMYYAGMEMGEGTRALLRWYWEQQGRPGGDFQTGYVDGLLRAAMGK